MFEGKKSLERAVNYENWESLEILVLRNLSDEKYFSPFKIMSKIIIWGIVINLVF